MRIEELEPNKKIVNVSGKIQKLEEPKVNTIGKPVQEGILSDITGQVKFTLWDDDAGKYKEGDAITFVTGWCKMFEDELQISAGKFGRVTKYFKPEKKS